MRAKRPSVLRGLITGAAAGIAATLIMDQFLKLTTASHKDLEKKIKLARGASPFQIAHEEAQQEKLAAAQEDSTQIVARKIAKATGTTLDGEQKKTAGRAVHYSFGTLMGIVYGVSARCFPKPPPAAGTAFGTLLFLSADEVAVPALQLAPAAGSRPWPRSPPALGRPRRLRRLTRTRPPHRPPPHLVLRLTVWHEAPPHCSNRPSAIACLLESNTA